MPLSVAVLRLLLSTERLKRRIAIPLGQPPLALAAGPALPACFSRHWCPPHGRSWSCPLSNVDRTPPQSRLARGVAMRSHRFYPPSPQTPLFSVTFRNFSVREIGGHMRPILHSRPPFFMAVNTAPIARTPSNFVKVPRAFAVCLHTPHNALMPESNGMASPAFPSDVASQVTVVTPGGCLPGCGA